MYLRKYNSEQQFIVAVCDEDILGKEFSEGELVLKLEESFYKGDEVCEEEVKEALSCATIANITGKRAVACAVDCGCIDPDNIIFIDNIPHAQMVRI